jgi:HSP20 family molecular chaperone IbpA
MDVYEFPERYRITMGLPGIDPESIRVARVGQGLRVTAVRPVELVGDVRVRRLEIPRGVFQRDIELPPGQFAVESCNFANGCLILDLVKVSDAQR